MTFDPTITIGAVLIVISQVGTMFWFAARMDKRIDLLAVHVDNLGKRVDAQAETIKEYTRIGERFAVLEGRVTNHGAMMAVVQQEISDLRRGEGFISGHRGVDGEYSA